jgi:hypothetical protein
LNCVIKGDEFFRRGLPTDKSEGGGRKVAKVLIEGEPLAGFCLSNLTRRIDPAKISTTKSPGSVKRRMKNSGNFAGNLAG